MKLEDLKQIVEARAVSTEISMKDMENAIDGQTDAIDNLVSIVEELVGALSELPVYLASLSGGMKRVEESLSGELLSAIGKLVSVKEAGNFEGDNQSEILGSIDASLKWIVQRAGTKKEKEDAAKKKKKVFHHKYI